MKRQRSNEELLETFRQLDVKDLSLEVAWRIWEQAIYSNDLYYEEADRLGKTFNQLYTLIYEGNRDEIWKHFWMKRYAQYSESELERYDEDNEEYLWSHFVGKDLPPFMVSWKIYFLHSYSLERRCLRNMGKIAMSELRKRAEKETQDLHGNASRFLFIDDQLQGPADLLQRPQAILPNRWEYVFELTALSSYAYIFHYPDGKQVRNSITHLQEYFLDSRDGITAPIFMELYLAVLFSHSRLNGAGNAWLTRSPAELFKPSDKRKAFSLTIWAQFLRQAYLLRHTDEWFRDRKPLFGFQSTLPRFSFVRYFGIFPPLSRAIDVLPLNKEGKIYLSSEILCSTCQSFEPLFKCSSCLTEYCGEACWQEGDSCFSNFTHQAE